MGIPVPRRNWQHPHRSSASSEELAHPLSLLHWPWLPFLRQTFKSRLNGSMPLCLYVSMWRLQIMSTYFSAAIMRTGALLGAAIWPSKTYVTKLEKHSRLFAGPWSDERKQVPLVLIPYDITAKASQPFEPIRVAASRCESIALYLQGLACFTVKSLFQPNKGRSWQTIMFVPIFSLIFVL